LRLGGDFPAIAEASNQQKHQINRRRKGEKDHENKYNDIDSIRANRGMGRR
jgi:hypothetical protein